MATVLTSCCSTFVEAQTTTVIPANEAAAHIGEYASVKGVVAKVFTSKSGNTFLNIGVAHPNQTIPRHRQSRNLRRFQVSKGSE